MGAGDEQAQGTEPTGSGPAAPQGAVGPAPDETTQNASAFRRRDPDTALDRAPKKVGPVPQGAWEPSGVESAPRQSGMTWPGQPQEATQPSVPQESRPLHAPAGWYPDPVAQKLRRWDGQAWTGELRQPTEQASAVHLAIFAKALPLAGREGRQGSLRHAREVLETTPESLPFLRHHAAQAASHELWLWIVWVPLCFGWLVVLLTVGPLINDGARWAQPVLFGYFGLCLLTLGIFMGLRFYAATAAGDGRWYRYPLPQLVDGALSREECRRRQAEDDATSLGRDDARNLPLTQEDRDVAALAHLDGPLWLLALVFLDGARKRTDAARRSGWGNSYRLLRDTPVEQRFIRHHAIEAVNRSVVGLAVNIPVALAFMVLARLQHEGPWIDLQPPWVVAYAVVAVAVHLWFTFRAVRAAQAGRWYRYPLPFRALKGPLGAEECARLNSEVAQLTDRGHESRDADDADRR